MQSKAKQGKARPGRIKAGCVSSKAGPQRSKTEPGGGKAGLGRGKVGTRRGKACLGAAKQHLCEAKQRICTTIVYKRNRKGVFGLHRRKRSAFLAEIGKVRRSRSEAGPRRSKASHFAEKGFNNTPQRSGRKCVWTAQAQADRVSSEIR